MLWPGLGHENFEGTVACRIHRRLKRAAHSLHELRAGLISPRGDAARLSRSVALLWAVPGRAVFGGPLGRFLPRLPGAAAPGLFGSGAHDEKDARK